VSKRNSQREVKFENDKWLPALSFIIEDQINNQLDTSWFPWLKEPPSDLGTIEHPRVVSDSSSGFGSIFKKKEEIPVQNLQPTTRKKPSWATRKSGQSQLSDTPSAQTPTSPTAAFDNTPTPTVDLRKNGPRVMVFMIGGATFSELRSVSNLEMKYSREILLGSTHTWTPDGFVESLKDLSKRNVQGSKFYGFQRPVDTRIKTPGRDDIPQRPRMESRDAERPRQRAGSGSSSSRREQIPPRPAERNSGRERRPSPPSDRRPPPAGDRRPDRRSPPSSPPRRPSSNNRSRPDNLPEELDRLNVRSNSGRRDVREDRERGTKDEEKKTGWFWRK
jgi:Sec1 family